MSGRDLVHPEPLLYYLTGSWINEELDFWRMKPGGHSPTIARSAEEVDRWLLGHSRWMAEGCPLSPTTTC